MVESPYLAALPGVVATIVCLGGLLRLSKGGFEYWWRSHLDPAWNHYVRSPVRFWSHDGPDEAVLSALAERRFADLPRLEPTPGHGMGAAGRRPGRGAQAPAAGARLLRGGRLAEGAPRLRAPPG